MFPFVKNEISDFTEEVTNEDENGRISSFINQDRWEAKKRASI